MPKDTKPTKDRQNTTVRPDALHMANIAASLTREPVVDVISAAVRQYTAPILKRHGVKIPELSATGA